MSVRYNCDGGMSTTLTIDAITPTTQMSKRRREPDVNESNAYPICEHVIDQDITNMLKTEAEALLNLRILNTHFNVSGTTAATRFLSEDVLQTLRQKLRRIQSGMASCVVISCEDMHSGDNEVIGQAVCTFLNALMSCTVNPRFTPILQKTKHSPNKVGFTFKSSLSLQEFWHKYLPASRYRLDFVEIGCGYGYGWTPKGLREVWTQMRRYTYFPFLDYFSSDDIKRCICECL
jgi:hypothetical protein